MGNSKKRGGSIRSHIKNKQCLELYCPKVKQQLRHPLFNVDAAYDAAYEEWNRKKVSIYQVKKENSGVKGSIVNVMQMV